ncbi:Protein ABSCISIC ACID-INSENSITIVE 5 [Platanthera zijinensis]|uniref:Protein ABSCISIC ACID-INSENSITIVE 5 n=1 Tax=Platanthera zijinensis TaxID=2320716 RepID=A0AAP0BP07_9ASPA
MAALTQENDNTTLAEEGEVTSQRPPPEMDVSFPLARQSFIYSRTLDQIHNTVCEPGKNFASMNKDEFLTNLWTVEESGFISAVLTPFQPTRRPCPALRTGRALSPAFLRRFAGKPWKKSGRRSTLRSSSVDNAGSGPGKKEPGTRLRRRRRCGGGGGDRGRWRYRGGVGGRCRPVAEEEVVGAVEVAEEEMTEDEAAEDALLKLMTIL